MTDAIKNEPADTLRDALGPNAKILGGDKDGFAPVGVLVGACVYLRQMGAVIVLEREILPALIAALSDRATDRQGAKEISPGQFAHMVWNDQPQVLTTGQSTTYWISLPQWAKDFATAVAAKALARPPARQPIADLTGEVGTLSFKLASARGHMQNIRAHGRAEDYGCMVIENALGAVEAEAATLTARLAQAEGATQEAMREMTRYAREAGEAKGLLEGSEAAGAVAGWRERAEKAEQLLRAAPLHRLDPSMRDAIRAALAASQAGGIPSSSSTPANSRLPFSGAIDHEDRN